jgi:hypothetical protein
MLAARLEDRDGVVLFGLIERGVQRVQHGQRHHIGLAVVHHDGADRAGAGIGCKVCHSGLPVRLKASIGYFRSLARGARAFFRQTSMQASAARMGAALTLQIRRHHRACPGDPRLASCFS